MAKKKKMPERYKTGPKKGQFKPKSSRSSSAKRNPGRTTRAKSSSKSSSKSKSRRRPARSNPPAMFRPRNIMGHLVDSGVEAGQILVGKALARSVPDLANLPKQGNVGLAVQTGVALASGWAASMFLSPAAARAITAGGLTAPLETMVVAYNVPWLSRALAPVTASNDLGAYVQRRRARPLPAGNGERARRAGSNAGNGMGAYVPKGRRRPGGLGRYSVERGMRHARA